MLPAVYDELRRLAAHYMSQERTDHTLQPTALVHEAYFQLREQYALDFTNRAQFLGVAARLMRRVLLHHAEARNAGKRAGYASHVSLDEALDCLESQTDVDFLARNAALERLAELDEWQAKVVEMRCFGGLTIDETAEALGVSPATVKRDWNVARLWLKRELS
ncbi:MAG: RNA polymerase subunit sigma-70 [Acidobacteria bacterium]|nr:RNA polymerase subunit sigma-70 [Acidobacteriota bacterium]